jgi:hypothetical protein
MLVVKRIEKESVSQREVLVGLINSNAHMYIDDVSKMIKNFESINLIGEIKKKFN